MKIIARLAAAAIMLLACPWTAGASEREAVALLYGDEEGLRKAAGNDPMAGALLIALATERQEEREEVLFHVAMALAESGRHDKALGVAKAIDGLRYRFHAFDRLSEDYLKKGETERALTILREAFAEVLVVKRYDPAYPRDQALIVLAERFAQCGDFTRSLETAAAVENLPWRGQALAKAAAHFAKQKRKTTPAEAKLLRDIQQALPPPARPSTAPPPPPR